jgi:hypothetical protein
MESAIKSWIFWFAVIIGGGAIYGAFTNADRGSSGEVVEEGTVSAFEIRIGDCLTDMVGSQEMFSEVNAVPCDQPHAFEAYHNEDVSGDSFPTDLDNVADEICNINFENYVGSPVDTTNLTFSYFIPTKESWENANDRQVTCLVEMDDGSDVTGSLRNSQ